MIKVEILGRNKFRLIEDYYFSIEYRNPMRRFYKGIIGDLQKSSGIKSIESEKITFCIPTGFKTDFASVPRIFWWLIAPIDNHARAALIHDFLYKEQLFSRKLSDIYFKLEMDRLNVAPWKSCLMYYSVRLFGGIPWKNKKKN